MFGQNTGGTKEPQTQHSNRLLDYTSSILSHMQDYIIDKIKTRKLHFDSPGQSLDNDEEIDRVKLMNMEGGLEPMSYFLFKLAYDDDSRYGKERIERCDDFEEFLPISTE